MIQLHFKYSCRTLFKTKNILILPLLYIIEIPFLLFLNLELISSNQIHQPYQLRDDTKHCSVHCVSLYEKGAHYSVLKLLKHLHNEIKTITASFSKCQVKIFY